MSNASRPAVFVDRDNTLIADPGYLRDPDQVRILPGVPDALRRLRAAGFAVVIVTNQSGVARGYFTEDELRAVHERLQEMLAEKGAAVDAIYSCPFLAGREAVVEEYRVDSDLRKPKPGMITKAAAELGLDSAKSWMIGDSARDVQAGRAAGCRTILLGSGATDPEAKSDHTMSDFPAAVDYVLRESKRNAEIRSALSTSRGTGVRPVNPARKDDATPQRIEPPATPSKPPRSTTQTSSPTVPRLSSRETPPPSRAPLTTTDTEQKSMTQAAATRETPKASSRPKEDVAEPIQDKRPTDERAVPDPDSPFDVLEQILDEVRAMRRQRQFADFSFAQLAGAVAQAFAVCAIGFGLYSSVDGDSNRATVALLTGIAFQLMALTGFMITRRR